MCGQSTTQNDARRRVKYARLQWVLYSTLVAFLDRNASIMPWDGFKPHWV